MSNLIFRRFAALLTALLLAASACAPAIAPVGAPRVPTATAPAPVFPGAEWARIGYLMLRQGEWNGRQLVPREWVRESTRPVTRRSEMNPAHRREGR